MSFCLYHVGATVSIWYIVYTAGEGGAVSNVFEGLMFVEVQECGVWRVGMGVVWVWYGCGIALAR
jgi:hypothetical protein